METVELVNSINKVATDEGLALDAGITGEDFIRIVSTKSGATWATMHTSLFQPETWMCYTEFPDKMLYLLKLAAPVFGNSKTEWPNNFDGNAYFEVDIGYRIREEAVTLTNGERLKGWVVSPPQITAKRGAEYDLIRQANVFDNSFCFWRPGYSIIRSIKKREVRKIEATEKSKDDDLD